MKNMLLKLHAKYIVATSRASKGQGVIEYAGALVIAAVVVALVLSVGPKGISSLFTTILTAVQNFFTGQLSSNHIG